MRCALCARRIPRLRCVEDHPALLSTVGCHNDTEIRPRENDPRNVTMVVGRTLATSTVELSRTTIGIWYQPIDTTFGVVVIRCVSSREEHDRFVVRVCVWCGTICQQASHP